MMVISTVWKTAVRRAGICIVTFAFVVSSVSVTAALYGPRVTVGEYYQQTSSTTSRDGINEAPCDNNNPGGSCDFMFQVAPDQKSIIVEHVSCSVFSSPDVRSAILHSRKSNSTLPFRYSVLTPVRTSVIGTVVSGTVLHPLAAGERALVQVDFGSTTNVSGFCTISGRVMATP
jgi:hypothetical protein